MSNTTAPRPNGIKNIFWKHDEKRLRTGWRLILHILGLVIMVLVSDALFSLLMGAVEPLIKDSLILKLIFRAIDVNLWGICILISLWLAGRWLDRRPFKAFGFALNRRWWLDFGFGAVLGAVLMAAIFGVEYALGWVKVTGTLYTTSSAFWAGLVFAFAHFLNVSIQEETITRAYWLRNLAEGFNFRKRNPRLALIFSLLLTSSIFGLMHLGNPNASLVSTLNLILAGLFLALPFVLTGEMAISLGLHLTWNFFQGNIFGFPVSGGTSHTTWLAIDQGGPAFWTGSTFGPEAGMLGILAILLGCGLIWLWVKLVHGRTGLMSELAVYHTPAAPGKAKNSEG